VLLKFAYDGTRFYGYQRQPGVPTVEGEILRVLREYKIAGEIKSASRTDRGVSALGNVIYLATDASPDKVIGILNSNLRHIFFHGYSDEDTNPRFARQRWYRYHLPDFGYSISELQEAAAIFLGEHDFRNFTRARENTVLRIDSIEISRHCDFFVIDFRARYYLWNLIRRIVAAITAYASGHRFDEEIFNERRNFGLAPPEPLILMDVQYDFSFIPMRWKGLPEKAFNRFSENLVYYYLYALQKKWRGLVVSSPQHEHAR